MTLATDFDFYLLVALAWVLCALISFCNGILRRLHTLQWLLISLLLGPIALVAGLCLSGRGPRVSLFSRERSGEPTAPPTPPRDLHGRPIYDQEIAELKRRGQFDEAIRLLETLIDAVEDRARELGEPVPGWYYEQLANLYRRGNRPRDEASILKRFADCKRRDDSRSRRLVARLERLRAKS